MAGIGKHSKKVSGGGALGRPDGMGLSGDGGPATGAMLSTPSSVAIGPDGNLYIADTGNDRIRKVDLDTGIITTFADGGAIVGKQYAPDAVPGMSSGDYEVTFKYFSPPVAVAVNREGALFIADRTQNKIMRIGP